MTAQAPPQLIEVRCPTKGHLLFRAGSAQFGTLIGTLCRKCGQWVSGTHADAMRVGQEPPQ